MTEGLTRDPAPLSERMEEQQLLDFDQDMLLVLSRDLCLFHQGMKVLLVEPRRGVWMVLPQSDFFFVQQLRTPTLLSTFLKHNAWLPEEFVRHVVLHMYARGFLEVNGAALWDPPDGDGLASPVRYLELDLGEQQAWKSVSSALRRALQTDRRPLEVTLHRAPPGPAAARVLGEARQEAERRGVELRLCLSRESFHCPEAFLRLLMEVEARALLGPLGGGEAMVASVRALREQGTSFHLRLPWREAELFWKALEEGAPGVETPFEEIPLGPRASRLAEEMLARLDEVLERDFPPFHWRNLSPLVSRLLQFPWRVPAAECPCAAGGAVVGWDGACYPCRRRVGDRSSSLGPAHRRGVLERAWQPAPRREGARRPWWACFVRPCRAATELARNRFYQVLLEGLMWRLSAGPDRVAAQLAVGAPGARGGEA